jgi:hypothetical protein
MQSKTLGDLSDMSNTEQDSNQTQVEIGFIKNKKRKRTENSRKFSKKEEDRILKYALKLSEKEFQANKLIGDVSKIRLPDLENCSTFHATEKDFEDPVGYFDSLWTSEETSTGIIKIITPAIWATNQQNKFANLTKKRIENSSKKLSTRKQVLNQLNLAQVLLI